IYQDHAPAVAFVSATRQSSVQTPFGPSPDGAATGSGFVVDDQGHILTNAHVVTGSSEVEVTLGDDDNPIDAEVVGEDLSTDVALLEVDPSEVDVEPFELADSSQLNVGDPIIAIGNPFGLERTVTTGIVSALQRAITAPNDFTISDVIQHAAAINPGTSGGPLLDIRGRVIGINSQIQTAGGGGSVGVGFAVPVNTARSVSDQLLGTGEVRHAFLGVTGADVSSELADALDLSVESGALIQSVTEGGPADEAGLRAGDTQVDVSGQQITAGGDIVVAGDGEVIDSMADVVTAVNRKQPGETVTLDILRDGEREQLTVELGERPASPPS
ncbi:MAG: S1C family serine protease, partial [Solirubrobacterales bacterium]